MPNTEQITRNCHKCGADIIAHRDSDLAHDVFVFCAEGDGCSISATHDSCTCMVPMPAIVRVTLDTAHAVTCPNHIGA